MLKSVSPAPIYFIRKQMQRERIAILFDITSLWNSFSKYKSKGLCSCWNYITICNFRHKHLIFAFLLSCKVCVGILNQYSFFHVFQELWRCNVWKIPDVKHIFVIDRTSCNIQFFKIHVKKTYLHKECLFSFFSN